MTPLQFKSISRSFRTELSRLEAAQAQARRSRRLESASRRAHRRTVRLMAEAFGVGAPTVGPRSPDGWKAQRCPVGASERAIRDAYLAL